MTYHTLEEIMEASSIDEVAMAKKVIELEESVKVINERLSTLAQTENRLIQRSKTLEELYEKTKKENEELQKELDTKLSLIQIDRDESKKIHYALLEKLEELDFIEKIRDYIHNQKEKQ